MLNNFYNHKVYGLQKFFPANRHTLFLTAAYVHFQCIHICPKRLFFRPESFESSDKKLHIWKRSYQQRFISNQSFSKQLIYCILQQKPTSKNSPWYKNCDKLVSNCQKNDQVYFKKPKQQFQTWSNRHSKHKI